MVELIINDSKIELPKNTQIKYTKQISDIFDLSAVACSFTNSFEFDKAPNNSQIMQQAGISGDSSNIPYQKNNASLKSDGFDLISKGWFNLQSTEDNYKGSIIDGMVDFFKAIENKTIGIDLDLKNFEHTKNMNTVMASFTNEYYKYLVADYGGKTNFNDGINIDYLAPSFSVRKIWELIFSTFGFQCDYANLSYLDGLFLTYPKDIAETQIYELIATLNKAAYISNSRVSSGDFCEPISNYNWSSNIITEGYLISNWKYVIPESSSYNFNLAIEMYATYRRSNYYDRRLDVSVYVLKNGIEIGVLLSDYNEGDNVGQERNLDFNLGCEAGDVIELKIKALNRRDFRGKYFNFYQWRHNKTEFKISKANLGTTTLGNELKDFLIRDFIKEIIWRTGLTPISNKENNTIYFTTLDSRIDFSNAQDFSHCFVDIKSETYQNGYAQKNSFKLKRDIETDTSGDGFLFVNNVNLPDEKTIVQSKIYAPDNKVITSFGSFNTNRYKIWETETKENDDVIELNYKGLSGRFYFIRNSETNGTFKLTSEKLSDEETVSFIVYANNLNTVFQEAVYNNYSEYQKIFNNFRIHNIDLAMTINDFIGADLTKPFYFKKENAYYLANKIPYEEGNKTTGEFIKINKL